MLEKLTEERIDKIMNSTDGISRILAVAAVAGAIILIIIPALWTVWR